MTLFNQTSSELFGINDGGILMLSASSWTLFAGQGFSIIVLLPLMDYLGRRAICVYVKFGLASLGTIFYLLAWSTQNGLFYLIGAALIAATYAIYVLGDVIFLCEMSPAEHKGTFSMLSLSSVQVFAQIVTWLAREDVWGTSEKWIYIPILAQAKQL
ncbi:unnamed protein product, partial [Mesorhabditis spiculigera]